MNKDKIYKKILTEAHLDPNIIGFVLGGGRGKGFVSKRSDYDIVMIVREGKKDVYEKKYLPYNSVEKIELGVWTLSEFKKYAAWGTEDEFHAYNFTYLNAQVDKTGQIQKIIDEKGKIPPSEIKKFVSGGLDAFINSYYRALKNHRDKNYLASHLDAVESLPSLITIFFGLEGRLRPYNKYLEWELKNYPLKYLPWSAKEFIGKIKKILKNGDILVMKAIFKKVYRVFGEHGYTQILKGWDGYKLD